MSPACMGQRLWLTAFPREACALSVCETVEGVPIPDPRLGGTKVPAPSMARNKETRMQFPQPRPLGSLLYVRPRMGWQTAQAGRVHLKKARLRVQRRNYKSGSYTQY